MGKISEKAKDFLHDATDYVLIIAIVLVVFVVMIWRLDVLFTKDNTNNESKNTAVEESVESEENTDAPKEEQSKTVNFEIPDGSLPPTVANILFEKGLINDKVEFLQKSRDLGLDTEFRPGAYEVKDDISLENLIKEISMQE